VKEIVDIIVQNNLQRKELQERVKLDSNSMLEGFTLTSLKDIDQQLKKFGEAFVERHSEVILDTLVSGSEMAKQIQTIAKETKSEN